MANTKKKLPALCALAGALSLGSCSGGEPGVTSVNPVSPSYSHLQVAVGTANFAGAATGLNVVETLRQPSGLSAVGYSTPSLAWDGAFTNTAASILDGTNGAGGGGANGPNVDDGQKQISGTAPVQLGTVGPASTFGQGVGSWGAFGLGFYPANSGPGNVNASIVYPCLPIYDNGSGPVEGPGCAAGAHFIGGPPAFPEVQNGSALPGEKGATLGFTPFIGLKPAAGHFTLTLVVPTGFNGNTAVSGKLTASATLSNVTPLGTFTTPTFTPDGAGGGSFAYTLPSGVTEADLFLINLGPGGGLANCNFGAPPFYYTVHVTTTSPNPVGLGYNGTTNDPGDNLGPNPVLGGLPSGKTLQTLCSAAANSVIDGSGTPGDMYVVYAVGFDYPAYGTTYPNSNGNATPAIAGTNGQTDVTFSAVSAPVAVPYSTMHRPLTRTRWTKAPYSH